MTFSSQFGERLRDTRKERKLTQDQAAAVAGVSREYWGRCERDLGGILGGEALAKLALDGWDIAYLLTGMRTAAPALRDGEAELLEGYRALNAREKLGVKALIAGMSPAAGVSVTQHAAPGTTQIGQVGDLTIQTPPPARRVRR